MLGYTNSSLAFLTVVKNCVLHKIHLIISSGKKKTTNPNLKPKTKPMYSFLTVVFQFKNKILVT